VVRTQEARSRLTRLRELESRVVPDGDGEIAGSKWEWGKPDQAQSRVQVEMPRDLRHTF